jgi:hypothetical protein
MDVTAGPQYPPPSTGRACAVCGAHALVARETPLTRKRRVKFGFLWLVFCIVTGGLGLIVYLVWPRRTEVLNVDRFLVCTTCNARQS